MAQKKAIKSVQFNQDASIDIDVLSFEDALAALENITEELEKDDLPLDRALSIFERGIVLMRKCETHLNSAQGKVKELLKGENGEYVEKVLGTTLESFLSRDDD